MHENREISSTPWSDDQGRSAKAINRTADMHVLEKSDCAVVPVNQPNKGGKPSAEVGEGRARAVENIVQSHMLPTQSGNCMSQGMGGVRQAALPPLIHGKSRMRRRARTDLCGGRSVMIVPTATIYGDGLTVDYRKTEFGEESGSNLPPTGLCRTLDPHYCSLISRRVRGRAKITNWPGTALSEKEPQSFGVLSPVATISLRP
jgi:hypothetical protein